MTIEISSSDTDTLLFIWRDACKRDTAAGWASAFVLAGEALKTCPPAWADEVSFLRDIAGLRCYAAPDVGAYQLPRDAA